MTVLHPVATNAEAALAAPLGRAARAREATALAGAQVVFAVETVGPAFETRGAALDAYAGRVEDDRPGKGRSVPPEDRWCELRETLVAAPPAPAKPVLAEGRRWPAPPPPPRTVWRLSVAYWKLVAAEPVSELDQARRVRRRADVAAELDAAALRRLASQPLRPVRPQQPLELGLFEVRMPENPDLVMPDE